MPTESRDNRPEEKANLARLLSSQRSALYAYIFACLRNHYDAEEVLQDVFVAVLSSLQKLNHESEFLPWAREIARRQILSFFRKSRRPIMYDTELVDILAITANHSDYQDNGFQRKEALRACIERLSPKSRAVIRMRYGGAMEGVEEIAAHLGRTMSATYGVLKRIRMQLRSCVERKMATENRNER